MVTTKNTRNNNNKAARVPHQNLLSNSISNPRGNEEDNEEGDDDDDDQDEADNVSPTDFPANLWLS
jgi:hypothetical protein